MQIYLYVGYTHLVKEGDSFVFFFFFFFDQMRTEMYSKNVHYAIYIYWW